MTFICLEGVGVTWKNQACGLAAVGFSDVRIVRMILPLCLAESSRHGASRILVRVTLRLWGEGSAAPGKGTPYFPHQLHWPLAAPSS